MPHNTQHPNPRHTNLKHPRAARIEDIITKQFSPQYLLVTDDSHLHSNHNKDALEGGTHFTLTLQSSAFKDKTRVQIHRLIMDALALEFKNGLHALKINIKDS
jgi:BolA protein